MDKKELFKELYEEIKETFDLNLTFPEWEYCTFAFFDFLEKSIQQTDLNFKGVKVLDKEKFSFKSITEPWFKAWEDHIYWDEITSYKLIASEGEESTKNVKITKKNNKTLFLDNKALVNLSYLRWEKNIYKFFSSKIAVFEEDLLVDSSDAYSSLKRYSVVKKFSQKSLPERDKKLVELFVFLLPVTLVEVCEDLKDFVEKNYLGKPRFCCFMLSHFSNPVIQFLAIKLKKEGVKVIEVQHGGCYGEIKNVTAQEYIERKHSDFFITYGWKETNKELILPSLRLSRVALYCFGRTLKRKAGSTIKNVMLVLTQYDRNSFANCESGYKKYIDSVLCCVREISLKKKWEIKIRPAPQMGSKAFHRYIAEKIKNTNISISTTKETLPQSALSSDLTIFTQYGATGFLECLAVKAKAIILNIENVNPRESAKEYFKNLIQKEILFENTDRLLKTDLNKKWCNSYLKNITDYKRNFCRFSYFWIFTWLWFLATKKFKVNQ